MSTAKHFDYIAIACIIVALVATVLISMRCISSPSDPSGICPSKEEISKVTANIVLGNKPTVQGSGAAFQEHTLRITASGTYHLQGTWNNGQIYVDVDGNSEVILVLNGVTLTNEDDSPIYVSNCKTCYLYLTEGTKNTIFSGNLSNKKIDSATGGAVTFKDDAVIFGSGTLVVGGYINNGIHCSKNLYIEDGVFTIDSVNKAIRGGSSLTVDGGSITINSCWEGLEATHITINNGDLSIIASDDGMNAKSEDEHDYAAMIDAAESIMSDSNRWKRIYGKILKKILMFLYPPESIDLPSIIFNGGTTHILSFGDGVDSNGTFILNDGYLFVNNSAQLGDNPIDIGTENDGHLLINGGQLFALSTNYMATRAEDTSLQGSFSVEAPFIKGQSISIYDSNNNLLISATSQTDGRVVVFSGSAIEAGSCYTLYVDNTQYSITQESMCSGHVSFSVVGEEADVSK